MASLDEQVREACVRARQAARAIASRPTKDKNAALAAIAAGLEASAEAILAANRADLDAARAKGTKDAMLDRLMLNESRIASMVTSVREVMELSDPVGDVVSTLTR